MELWNEALRAVLRQQVEPVGVLDATGKKVDEIDARLAASRYDNDYVGVGNRRRIRFIKPVHMRRVPPISGEQIRKAIADDPRVKRYRAQQNRKSIWRPGRVWPVQPSKSRSGQVGRIKTVFINGK